jgi:L-alanine-DL-glutamate epimerase-like enolase superfamily enzyme
MSSPVIEAVSAAAYRVPTEQPESDGTLEWDSVTVVVAEVQAGGARGIGYTYADRSAAVVIEDVLSSVVCGRNAHAVSGAWSAMTRAVRNLGADGVCATAISAVDVALWDLKARLLGMCLADLLGRSHEGVPIYGSGGLTSYTDSEVAQQFGAWVDAGIPRVKMKVGRDPAADLQRVRNARSAIGPGVALFVDANGAYSRKQALALAESFARLGVSWLEEPVSSDDLTGLRLIRDRAPAGMNVAAGEYGYRPIYFRRMLEAGAVDVLQADATRVGGITGLLNVGALCSAFEVPFSTHCAPQIHAHVGCAIERLVHCEYFHTHARAERLLFDGTLDPVGGELIPDARRPGLGIELKQADALQFRL